MIRCLAYNAKKELADYIEIQDIKKAFTRKDILWVDIEQPKEEEINILRDVFNFHPLAIEDCVNSKQRPKVDQYKDFYFIIMHALEKNDDIRVSVSELNIFLGENYIVTFHKKNIKFIESVYERYQKTPSQFEKGIDFIFYSLIDELVDEYFPILDNVGFTLEKLEELAFKDPNPKTQNELFKLKNNVFRLRKILSPQREVLNIILRHDFSFVKEENRVYFMDVYDHLVRLFDLVDTYHDIISGALEAYLSSLSNKLNEIMKVLTIITTIMMPLSLIAGIYGMNFQYMPELKWRYGYLWALGLMAFVVIVMLVYFKKKKWI